VEKAKHFDSLQRALSYSLVVQLMDLREHERLRLQKEMHVSERDLLF